MKTKTRAESVEYMVSQGYSREFAEAFIPMTVAEARAQKMESMQYVSAFSQINRGMARKGR